MSSDSTRTEGHGLIERLIGAGTPAPLVAEVAMALGRAEAALAAVEARRARDRERKRKLPRPGAESEPCLPFSAEAAECGGSGSAKEIPPNPHKKITPLKTPEGVHPPGVGSDGEPKQRAQRLPDDFEVPGDWLDWAIERRSWDRAEALEEAECFCRYWQARGQGAAKRSWKKTWQNWVVNSRRRSGGAGFAAAAGVDPPPGKWTPERMAAYRRGASSDEDAGTRARRLRSIGSIARNLKLETEE